MPFRVQCIIHDCSTKGSKFLVTAGLLSSMQLELGWVGLYCTSISVSCQSAQTLWYGVSDCQLVMEAVDPVSLIIQQTSLSLFTGSCDRFLKAARENRPLCETILNSCFIRFSYKYLLDKTCFLNWNMFLCSISVFLTPDCDFVWN